VVSGPYRKSAWPRPPMWNGRMDGQSEPGRPAAGNLELLDDVATLRQRARERICEGAVTASYPEDKDVIIRLLNEALATELVCVLRYKRHYYATRGLSAQ